VEKPEDVVKNTKEQRKRKEEKMEEKDQKAELDSEILRNYQEKEAKNIKYIFLTIFLLVALFYIVKFFMGFFS